MDLFLEKCLNFGTFPIFLFSGFQNVCEDLVLCIVLLDTMLGTGGST